MQQLWIGLGLLTLSGRMSASTTSDIVQDLTMTPYGMIALAVFVIAYLLVMLEERIHLAKSKPVLIAAGLIWLLIAVAYRGTVM